MGRAAGGEKCAIERGARAAAGGGAARSEPTQTATGVRRCGSSFCVARRKKNTFCALESYGDAVSQKNEDRLILLAPCEPTHTSKRTPRADHFARAR